MLTHFVIIFKLAVMLLFVIDCSCNGNPLTQEEYVRISLCTGPREYDRTYDASMACIAIGQGYSTGDCWNANVAYKLTDPPIPVSIAVCSKKGGRKFDPVICLTKDLTKENSFDTWNLHKGNPIFCYQDIGAEASDSHSHMPLRKKQKFA